MNRRTSGYLAASSFALIPFLLALHGRSRADGPISLSSLLDEMVDRDRLARIPLPSYSCRQASSYDRDAVSPENTETWYANWDRSQFVRVEENAGRKEHVLMDVAGPGAVVRIWATWHGPRGADFTDGTLRFYLDGDPQPAIEGPVTTIIDRGALTGPPLSQGVSPSTPYKHRGHNLYLPIPYANHCKITYETTAPMDRGARKGGEALYYQINYRTFESGAVVKTFTMDQLRELRPQIDRISRLLLEPGASLKGGTRVTDYTGTLEPGQEGTATVRGPAAIRKLTARLEAKDLPQALRSTVFEVSFDGVKAIWAPIGDFAGIGYKFTPYKTWYTEVTADGVMSCYWVMPFSKTCELKLRNLGSQPVNVARCEIHHGDWKWDERSMHFHSRWKELNRVQTRTNRGAIHEAFDVNYVQVQGRGVFVGDVLTLFNGAPSWWGEGDEKIFVDGERFPSHFGTGTEDYYGYAWGNPNFFAAPFHAQPYGKGANSTDVAVNLRLRSLDAIPFSRSFRFDMELWHWASTKMNYAPTTFFYARPGAIVNVKPDPAAAARPVALEADDIIPVRRVKGAIEGEGMKIVEKTGGVTEIQNILQLNWSGAKQLWWRDGKVGDRLVLEFSVDEVGRYEAIANLTKAVDYGIVQLKINGKTAGDPVDRYHTTVANDDIRLGVFRLTKGPNRLEVVISGSNTKAIAKHMFGLDYLLLRRAP